MQFAHDAALLTEFPQLAAATLTVEDVTRDADVAGTVAALRAELNDALGTHWTVAPN